MKFSNAVVLAAATGTYAQISVINDVLTSVGSGIDALDSAAKAFNGDVDAVKSKADALVAAIKAGKTKVDASSDLSLTDALGLTTPVQALTKKGQALADDFKSQRSAVEKASACDTVRGELADINSASQDLIKSVVSKVPTDAQVVAQQLAAGLTTVLTQASSDFSTDNCKNAGGASSAPASSAPATSAPASSAAASHTGAATSAPATTLAPSSTVAPTGGNSTATTKPPVTAGASFLAPAGALVMAVAAALL